MIVKILMFFGLMNQMPLYEQYSNEIIDNYKKEVLAPKNISISSLGGRSNNMIEKISIGVNVKGPISINDGRNLLVFLVNELIIRFNQCDKIRPYLLDNFFTEKNINFDISAISPKNNFWILDKNYDIDEQIAFIMLHQGNVTYSIKEKTGISPLKTIFEETFKKSEDIIKNSQ